MRLKKRPWGDVVIENNLDKVIKQDELDLERFQNYINYDHLVLEIGSGKGDFVIQMAKKYPEIRFIAIEMQSMALAYAVRKIQEDNIENIIFVNADAHYVNEKFINHKVETIFLNFSDPWPKKRHHKRRLTYPTMLEEYAKILKPEGKLIFKSDNDVLFADSVEYITDSPFVLDSVTYDYDGLDEYDAPTEYETRFRSIGTPIKRYIASLKKESK